MMPSLDSAIHHGRDGRSSERARVRGIRVNSAANPRAPPTGGQKLREQSGASARLEGCSRSCSSTAHVWRLDPEPEGHGAVVGEADEHVGTEAAARNRRVYLGGTCEEMREQAFARLG